MIKFWENIWKLIIIMAVMAGIIYVSYVPLKAKLFPSPTVFQKISTDFYSLKVPENWNFYTNTDKTVDTYSDLTQNSFIEGSITIYTFNKVVREDSILDESTCGIEQSQIQQIIDQEKNFEFEDIDTKFDSKENRCVTKATTSFTSNEEGFLDTQYHQYYSYQVDTTIIIFDLVSPEQELSQDLQQIINSIEVIYKAI